MIIAAFVPVSLEPVNDAFASFSGGEELRPAIGLSLKIQLEL